MLKNILAKVLLLFLSSCIPEIGKYQKVVYQNDYKIVYRYFDGLLDDTTKIYYPNGQLKEELFYKSGVLQGPSTMFDSLGKVISEVFYLNDTIQSLTVYDTDGQLFYEYKNSISAAYDYYGDSLAQIAYGHPRELLTYHNSAPLNLIVDSIYYPAVDSMTYPPWP